MEYRFCVILMMEIILISFNKPMAAIHSGICGNKSGDVTCCPNYNREGGLCIACPNGTFGTNCNNTCPDGFYGKFCREKCKCYPCNKAKGCQIMTNTFMLWPVDIDWRTAVLSSAGSLFVCFIIGITIYCKLRHDTSRGSYHMQDKGTYINRSDERGSHFQKNSTPSHVSIKEHLIGSTKQTNLLESLSCNERNSDPSKNMHVGVHDIKACSANKEIKKQKDSSRSVNDHNLESYDILSLKCNSSNLSRGNSFMKPVYNVAAYARHCSNTSEPLRSKSFLYPEQVLKKGEEIVQLQKVSEENSLLNSTEISESNPEGSKIPEKRKEPEYKESKKREREEYMYGFTMMLENFKTKRDSDANGENHKIAKDRRKFSKKDDRKMLRYSFACPLEMNK